MSKPVVLHVSEAFAKGIERHVIDLISHVDRFDHVLAVPSRHKGESTAGGTALAEKLGARVEHVEMTRSRAVSQHVWAAVRLRRLVGSLRPAIVHGHSSIGGALARIATVRTPIPLVYTPHGLSRMRWALVIERLLGRSTDRLIAVSESERDFALRHKLATEKQVVVIPNGIDPAPPPPLADPLRARLKIGNEDLLFGCVGRLESQKAPEVFVSACAICSKRLPEAHFVFIGSGPLKEEIEKAVAAVGLQHRFHLVDSLRNASAVFGEFDVYVLASRFEGAPYTPLEAMRAGTPVVVTDVAGNRDVVEHGVNGLMVPEDEPDALARAMLAIVDDPALARKVVDGGRRTLARFAVEQMASATAAVYQDLYERR